MDEVTALLGLIRAKLTGAQRLQLLERHGDALAILRGGPSAWRAAGLSAAAMATLAVPDRRAIANDLHWLDGSNRHVIAWSEADFPELLKRIDDPPAALFVEGDIGLLWFPQIAVVGSRRPSAVGKDNAARFCADLAANGLVITSGLAEGIDTVAHHSALLAGRTIAVLGAGPDVCFPAGNKSLLAKIAHRGAVVSEYPPGTVPRQSHFPARNRIIAGLSLGTLVVEAALRSGALITARLAAQAGREVFAIPGSIHNPLAQGCHRLIRQGAALVETPEEVAQGVATMALTLAQGLRQQLVPAIQSAPSSREKTPPVPTAMPSAQAQLLQLMGFEPVALDALAESSGLTVPRLSAILLAMELGGLVLADNGRYCRRV